jgi:glucose-1-phosphate adenylyltransferase
MPDQTITIVLADDPGEELATMTRRRRAKAAVPFGGEYRVIDFALSNCLHSGLRRILVFMGTHTYSLQKHLRDGWSIFNPELSEFITPVPHHDPGNQVWESGTTGQLAEHLHVIERSGAKRVLILNGGHVYRMDLAAMIAHHQARELDATIAYVEFDVGRVCGRPRISVENSESSDPRAGVVNPMDTGASSKANVIMGIYLIEMELFLSAMREDSRDESSGRDLEFDIIASFVRNKRVGAYRFGGAAGRVTQDRYWNDLASLDDYFRANLALLEPVPPLDLYQDSWPIWSRAERNPPARTVEGPSGNEGLFVNSIVSNGTVIRGGAVSRSVLFPRVRVDDGATVERSILCHGAHVGEGTALRNCIVDKHARIPGGEQIGFDLKKDRARFDITPGGVVVITRESAEALRGGETALSAAL